MSESFKDCPTIPELSKKVDRLVAQTQNQPMPAHPTPDKCPGATPEGYEAAKEAYSEAWDLVLRLGAKKAEEIFFDMLGEGSKLKEVIDAYVKCSDPDHECRRAACTAAKRLDLDFDSDRVALFQGMVREMDVAKEAFIEEAKACCEGPVEPVAGEGEDGEAKLIEDDGPEVFDPESSGSVVPDPESVPDPSAVEVPPNPEGQAPIEPTGEAPQSHPF